MPFGKTQRFPSESSGDCFVIADFLGTNSAVSIASVRVLSISTVSRIAWWSSSMVAVTTIAATRTASQDYLQAVAGLHVIRVGNDDVLSDQESVMLGLLRALGLPIV